MQEQCQARQRARIRRSVLEVGGFFVAAALVAGSAIVAKESQHGPALAALERVESPKAFPMLAAIDRAERSRDAKAQREESSAPGAADIAIETTEPIVEDTVRWFNGRPVRPARTLWMTVTAYSPDERSCGKWADGVTASGKSVWTNAMKLVAADADLFPFGSLVSVPGYDNGRVVPVLDRGGAIKGARLDVLYPTHRIAKQWGVQRLPVTVWEYAD